MVFIKYNKYSTDFWSICCGEMSKKNEEWGERDTEGEGEKANVTQTKKKKARKKQKREIKR